VVKVIDADVIPGGPPFIAFEFIDGFDVGELIDDDAITLEEAEWHHDPMTVVHSLVMDGSHSFIASGFVVSGWARDDDFDYATWTPREAPCP
jgi:hypothetical protein